MDYSHIYNQLISRGQQRQGTLSKKKIVDLLGYVERHHITPRCMGGSNDADNLVYLTPEEHFLAHGLLVKIYPTKIELLRALMILSGKDNKSRSNKLYGWARRRYSEMRKGATPWNAGTKGKGICKAWNKGIDATDTAKKKQSEKKKRQVSVLGVVYNSLQEAALAQGFGTNYNRVSNRCRSDLHPDWFYVDGIIEKRKPKIGKPKGAMSEESKEKMRDSCKGRTPTRGCFKKGSVPWNKK